MRHRATILLGKSPARISAGAVDGHQVVLDGEQYYRIENSDRLRPFLLTIVSSADHWMFISSNGALTAGRRNPDLALFPYYTDDKIYDGLESTGPKTILLVRKAEKVYLWEPLSNRNREVYRVRRNLYKTFTGDKIVFEEINEDLGLVFRYAWAGSEKFGWVRKSSLANPGKTKIHVRLLDGIQNILPTGIGSQFQLEKSTLANAYKKNELLPDSGLALFTLSSIPIDRPEPAESLRATTVWSAGIQRRHTLLSTRQIEKFRDGLSIKTETDIRGERGAYFVETAFALRTGQTRRWMFVADVNQSSAQVADLRGNLHCVSRLQTKVEADIANTSSKLWRIVARADGLQTSSHPISDARHFNNVLFNVMRGGIFPDEHQIDCTDLSAFVRAANRQLAEKNGNFFRRLGKTTARSRMLSLARDSGDPNLERLCCEYLPLTFSRRHGDPSRPWNRFSIAARAQNGKRVLDYEGNWRDIFQNWEALAVSFPGFVSGLVCKFVNASTADGYNPYRITRGGFDWETPDPQDPWSHIGYWGDHQIIYLLKLLEILRNHEPATLRYLLTRAIFCFANVPYKIKPYARLIENPRDTVEFDAEQDKMLRALARQIGSDGKLILRKDGVPYLVNLTEKLIISLLAKFANFVPGAGIWLNTQRPEWNDANNALVGSGASVVTLCHIRRHLVFCGDLFAASDNLVHKLSDEVATWLVMTTSILKTHSREKIDDELRAQILGLLGRAAEKYRDRIYSAGFCGRKTAISKAQLLQFISVALRATEQTISANKRPDGLYHSYNLLDFHRGNSIRIHRLYEMLEGQVAILDSKLLPARESLALLSSLRSSALYRADQNSYLLYPDRQLPPFTEKNNLPKALVAGSRLLKKLLRDNNSTLIERDASGLCHFNAAIKNAGDLRLTLSQLSPAGYSWLIKIESKAILALFETMFAHRFFTGRSGTFFGYEGLGSVYWHMVSKLRLAAADAVNRAASGRDDEQIVSKLARRYHDIRSGIGDLKTPENYGAFPMDPYSHTPAHAGARQPGLTGQVKEDILARFGELGVFVRNGQINFQPRLLRRDELLGARTSFTYLDAKNVRRRIPLEASSLAFTWCQVPIVYRLAAKSFLTVNFADGTARKQDATTLDLKTSRAIFERSGAVKSIFVGIQPADLR